MRGLLTAVLIVVLVGCSDEDRSSPAEKVKNGDSEPANQDLSNETLATELNVPWQINIVNDTIYYLSGRPGNIISIKGESKQKQDVELTHEIVANTESGLLGFYILNESKQQLEAIVYHTYEDGGKLLNRVVKVEKQEASWVETDILLENIPGGPIHNGGRVAIGPDGKLYITTGDAGEKELSQDQNSLAGKILRLNLDGTVPEDNPFPGSPVYTYGHRNPQGIDWTSEGKMYSSEHGSSAYDELNEIVPGGNYGWPVIRGDEEKEGMITPLFHSGEVTWAPSGIAVSGSNIYVACLAGKQIRVFDLENKTSKTFVDGFGRMRDVNIKDGYLYAITNNRDGRGNPTKEDDRLLKFPLSQE